MGGATRIPLSQTAALPQLPTVRVPLPAAIPLCLAVVAGTWWYGSRQLDFLTPPTPAELDAVRSRVESSLPPMEQPEDAVSAPPEARPEPPPPPPEPPKPVIDPGDLSLPPTLDDYHDLAAKGADHLIDLAVLLETEGEHQRALLAWERVLDAGKPDDAQAAAAIAAIKRLRPTLPAWNPDPSKAIPVVLHAGTGKKTARVLKPMLEETARELESASAGILRITTAVTTGKSGAKTSAPPPVALWLAGSAKDAPSSDVLSFTVESEESLHEVVRKTTFQIIRSYLARIASPAAPREMPEGTSALDALHSRITRRSWRELGTRLNAAPGKTD